MTNKINLVINLSIFGSVDLPSGVCEAVAGQGVSRSKVHDTSYEPR